MYVDVIMQICNCETYDYNIPLSQCILSNPDTLPYVVIIIFSLSILGTILGISRTISFAGHENNETGSQAQYSQSSIWAEFI